MKFPVNICHAATSYHRLQTLLSIKVVIGCIASLATVSCDSMVTFRHELPFPVPMDVSCEHEGISQSSDTASGSLANVHKLRFGLLNARGALVNGIDCTSRGLEQASGLGSVRQEVLEIYFFYISFYKIHP